MAARPDVLEPGARVLARMGLPESPVQIDDASDLGPVVTLSPAVVNAAPGDIVEITVAIDPDGLTLTAFEVVVEIDTNAVEFAGLEAGRLLGGDVIVGGVEFDSATGRALITVARAGVAAGPTDSGSVATLQLEILGTAQAGESNVRVAVRVTDEAFSLLGPFLASAPLMLLAR